MCHTCHWWIIITHHSEWCARHFRASHVVAATTVAAAATVTVTSLPLPLPLLLTLKNVAAFYDQQNMSGKARAVGSGQTAAPLDGTGSESESSASSIQDASEDSSSSSGSASESPESIGKKVARQRVCKSTRTRYESCLRQMGRWAKREGHSQTGRLVPPLQQKLVEGYFDYLDKRRVKWTGHSNPSQTKRLSAGAIRSVCTGVYHLYRMHNLSTCESLKIFFNNFNRYHVLNIAKDKANVPPLYPVTGGSQALSKEAYQLLCLRAWQYTPSTASGSATGRNWDNCRCLPLYWNLAKPLMSRRERLVRTQWEFMRANQDHMQSKTPTTKSDQEGMLSYWKAFFAMPHFPQCCPFLVLAIEVMIRSAQDDEASFRKIFPKSFADNSHSFIRTFVNSLGPMDKAVMNLGEYTVLPITSHTPKRSACGDLHACEGVNWNSAKQRGDHDIGVEGQYLPEPADGQDQIMGRVLAMMPFGWPDWMMLPPHFPANIEVPTRDLIPAFEKFPVQCHSLFPFLIASVVYHTEWLEANVPRDNPLFSIPLLSSMYSVNLRLRSSLKGGKYGGDVNGLKPTGYSIMGGTHATVQQIFSFLKEGGFPQTSAPSATPVAAQPESGPALPMQHIMRLLTDVHSVMNGKPSTLSTLPIADVPAVFTLPTGYRPEQLWRQWFGGRPRPWRFLVNKNLSTKQERDLLKKYHDIMEAIRCRVSVAWIEADIDGSFRACWIKFCQVTEFSCTCKWSCAYMYDKLTKTMEARLAATPVLSAKEFVAGKANQSLRAALQSVELAQGRVTEAAIEALPAALHQARQAQHAADAIVDRGLRFCC